MAFYFSLRISVISLSSFPSSQPSFSSRASAYSFLLADSQLFSPFLIFRPLMILLLLLDVLLWSEIVGAFSSSWGSCQTGYRLDRDMSVSSGGLLGSQSEDSNLSSLGRVSSWSPNQFTSEIMRLEEQQFIFLAINSLSLIFSSVFEIMCFTACWLTAKEALIINLTIIIFRQLIGQTKLQLEFSFINQENPRTMEAICAKIIRSGHRLAEKPISSATLVVLPFIFHIAMVFLIFTPLHSDSSAIHADPIAELLSKIRANIYFTFVEHQNYVAEHISLICLVSLSELIFLYLLLKPSFKQKERAVLKAISYVKLFLSLPILSVLLCSFKYMNRDQFLIVKIISAATILVTSVTEYLSQFLSFTCLYTNLNKKDQSYDEFGPNIKLILKLILGYAVLKDDVSRAERIGLSLVILVLHLALIWKLLVKKLHKYNPLIDRICYFGWIFIACYNFIILFEIWIKLIADNRWLVFISFFLWSGLAFKNVLEYTKGMLLIQSPDLIKTESEAIAYIRLLYNVYENRHEPSNCILLLGLVKNHSSECSNPACICKTRAKVVTSNLIKDIQFFLKFIELNIQELREKFSVYSVDIACLAFEIEVMKKFPFYFYKADIFRKKNEHKKMTLNQKFAMHLIEKVALKQVLEKSSDAETSNEKSLELLKSEKNIEECYVKLQSIVLNFVNFYKYNSRAHCGLELLKLELQRIYESWIEIDRIFGHKKTEEHISSEFIYLILFFYQNVFNMPFKTKPIMARLQILYKRLESKEVNQQKFDVSLYSENGCVIQSTLESNLFGLITKVSNNTPEIFKYPSLESMLNLDVHRLLPRCVREEHVRMVKKWLESGSFKNINKLQETFCYNYNESLFKVMMRSQIAVIDSKISVFVGIIKVDADNYMIVNKNNEIDSYGLDLGKILVNEYRFRDIEAIIPNWKAIVQDVRRQPTTIKAKMISHIKNADQPIRNSKLETSEDEYMVGMQVYKSNMRFEEFVVIRKLNSVKIDEQLAVSGSGDKNIYEDVPDSVNYRSSKLLTTDVNGDPFKGLVEVGSTSSKANDSNFSVSMMLQEITNRAAAGQSLSYPLLKLVTIILVTLFIFILITISCLFFFQLKGLDSFNQIIYADSAVSDNMQLLEILYNNMLMVGQHCITKMDYTKCQYVQNSMENTQHILGQLLVSDVENLLKNVTFLGHRYFEYEMADVNVTINGTVVTISTYQFMSYFVRESRSILNALKENKGVPNYLEKISHMQDNWLEMKRINYQNLQYYEGLGVVELNICIKFAVVLTVVYVLLMTLEMLVQCYLLRCRLSFVNSILSLFRRVSMKINQELAEYYQTLSGLLKMKDVKLLLKMQMPYAIENEGLTMHNYTPYTKMRSVAYLGVYWGVFIIMTTISTYKVVEYIQLQQNSIATLNKLMKSENDLQECYFELKSTSLYSESAVQDIDSLYSKIREKLGQNENEFVKTSVEISTLASTQNLNEAYSFSEIVQEDICEIIRPKISQEDYQMCANGMNLRMLEEGVLIVMTFFRNTILTTLQKLHDNEVKYPWNFDAKEFVDLDLYMLYLLRIYQVTQSKMVDILNLIMNQRMQTTNILVVLQALMQVGFITYWCLPLKNKCLGLAKSYGFMLIFPLSLLKESKFMQQQLNRLL